MAGNNKHHLFLVLVLVLVLIFRPADASYKLVLESGSAADVIKFMCSDLEKVNRQSFALTVKQGEPVAVYDLEPGRKVFCNYEYKLNDERTFVLFDGYKPDQDCRAELGGCTFVIKDAVVYKKLRSGGTRVMGDLPETVCKTYKLWWIFSFDYGCREKPHRHPYLQRLA